MIKLIILVPAPLAIWRDCTSFLIFHTAMLASCCASAISFFLDGRSEDGERETVEVRLEEERRTVAGLLRLQEGDGGFEAKEGTIQRRLSRLDEWIHFFSSRKCSSDSTDDTKHAQYRQGIMVTLEQNCIASHLTRSSMLVICREMLQYQGRTVPLGLVI